MVPGGRITDDKTFERLVIPIRNPKTMLLIIGSNDLSPRSGKPSQRQLEEVMRRFQQIIIQRAQCSGRKHKLIVVLPMPRYYSRSQDRQRVEFSKVLQILKVLLHKTLRVFRSGGPHFDTKSY